MAEYISFQPSDFFNTVLYTGDGVAIGSGGNAITGVGFQPDFTWIKNRDTTDNHILTDAVRGTTKYVSSDDADLQYTNTEYLTAFGADGFTVGSGNPVNTNTEDFASWNWKAGTTTGIDTTGSTITPTGYSFNATSRQSIVQYDGNSTSGAKVPHGLGVAPDVVIIKCLDAAETWALGCSATNNLATPLGNLGFTKYLRLDTTDAATTTSVIWNDTAPDAVNVTLGDNSIVNTHTTQGYIMYSFANTKGYFKSGVYDGNGAADGPFIYTGFRPAFIIVKKFYGTTGGSGSGDNYQLFDNKRIGYNADNNQLYPDATTVEGTGDLLDINSNGFKNRTTNGAVNEDNNSYFYMAFAESPIVSSNDVPTVAR